MELIRSIPKALVAFVLVTVFSLLIGLSQRLAHSQKQVPEHTFGTDRTFTFIGILGFILYIISPGNLFIFLAGGIVLAAFMAVNYFFNIQRYDDHGMTTIVIALITYTIGPLVMTQPFWLVVLVIVVVLIFTELKESFVQISKKFDKNEFVTLGKFLIMAGVILPVVPDDPVFRDISLTPYRIWLAVVVVSSISYLSYLLKKFVFQKGSIILSGILGGLYSSTATTVVLSRRIRQHPEAKNQFVAGIIFSVAMMYVRILALILIFSQEMFLKVYPYFLVLFLASGLAGFIILIYRNKNFSDHAGEESTEKNPLEFRVALLFTALYVVFSLLTYFVLEKFGTPGLNGLSMIVGLTDIDPFLINLFQGKFGVGIDIVAAVTMQAIISNNIVKMIYACAFANRKSWIYIITGFLAITALNVIFVFLL
jgi:uncharacterized membrane protein (DUF4010 family)